MKNNDTMKDHFIPYKYAKMMEELEFRNETFAIYFEDHEELHICKQKDTIGFKSHIYAPLYQQAEKWLWNNHFIIIEVIDVSTDSGQESPIREFECSVKIGDEYLAVMLKDSPLTAHREGILKAIECIYQNKN